jgi:hypothetical protein
MRKAANKPVNYGWTSDRMPGITHQGLNDAGGFGEVHEVSILVFLADLQMRNERTNARRREVCSFVSQ